MQSVKIPLFLMTLLLQDSPVLSNSCLNFTVNPARVVVGQSVELYCHMNSLPNKPIYHQKSWTKKNPQKNSGDLLYRITRDGATHRDAVGEDYKGRVVKLNDDMIRLTHVTQQDAEWYECNLDSDLNGCIRATASLTVTVIVPVNKVKLTMASVTQGHRATFRCTADGHTPITYTWQKVVGSLPGGGRWQGGSDGSVTLSNVQRSDAGSYTCTADNEANKPVNSATVYFDVYYPPDALKLTSSLPGLTHREKTQVALTCRADGGHPAPDVTIYRGTIPAQSGKSRVTLDKTLLKSDNGMTFVCKAKSKGINGEMPSNTITYDVTYPHTVTVVIHNTPVTEGGDVTLTCDASRGNPQKVLSYGWHRVTEFTPSRGKLLNEKQVTLTNITYRDAGKYECHVTNAGGNSSDEETLTVFYTAKLDPRFEDHKFVKHSDYGGNVTFRLKVIANPQPTFNWAYKTQHSNQSHLNEKENNALLHSELTIYNVTKHDVTTYTCVVVNSVGSSVFYFELKLAAAPDTPDDLQVVYTSVTTVDLSWISCFSGGYPQIFQLMYRKTGEPWPVKPKIQNMADPGEGSEVTYKLRGLNHSTSYEFRVKAVNSRPSGPNSSDFTAVVTTTTKEEPSVTNFNVVRDPGSSTATASWTVQSGQYSHAVIAVCETRCRYRNITASEVANQKAEIAGLDPNKKYTYRLMLYDNGDLVHDTNAVISEEPPVNTSWIAGVVVPIILILTIVMTVTGVLLYKRRIKGRNQNGLIKDHEDGFHNNSFTNQMAETDLRDLNQNPSMPVYGVVDKSEKKMKVKSEPENTDAKEETRTDIEENKNIKPDQESGMYAKIDISKKKNKKDKPGLESGIYAKIDLSKKKNKRSKPEAENNFHIDANDSEKESQEDKPEFSAPSTQCDLGEESAYQNRAELKQGATPQKILGENQKPYAAGENLREENAYQNFEGLKTKNKKLTHTLEKIVGADGILYEDPRNFDFDDPGKPPKKPKPKHVVKPTPSPKTEEEPTEYASIDFKKKV